MATYNGAKYIKEQLETILCQLSEDDELIISDDSSTDATIEIIKTFKDQRIQLLENQKFKSPIYNFENTLKQANGEYIFLADQDDIWMPQKIQILKKYLNNYDLVLSDAIVVDENKKVIYESFYNLNFSQKGFVKNLFKNSYLGCTMAFNRKILDKSLPFPRNLPMHDWWIGLIGEVYGRTYFIDEKLINYRRHGNNASETSQKSTTSFYLKLKWRLIIIYQIIKRVLRWSKP